MHRLLVCDLDGTLLGDRSSLDALLDLLKLPDAPLLAFASGRQGYSAIAELAQWRVAQGAYLIAGVGTELYRRIGKRWTPMASWPELLRPWNAERVRRELLALPGVRPQQLRASSAYKLSYFAAPQAVQSVRKALDEAQIDATLVHSHGDMLDVLPSGVDKGSAVSWLAKHLGVPLERVAACGNTANDLAMLQLSCAAIAVGGCDDDLRSAAQRLANVYVASEPCAGGIVEGLRAHGWLDGSRWVP